MFSSFSPPLSYALCVGPVNHPLVYVIMSYLAVSLRWHSASFCIMSHYDDRITDNTACVMWHKHWQHSMSLCHVSLWWHCVLPSMSHCNDMVCHSVVSYCVVVMTGTVMTPCVALCRVWLRTVTVNYWTSWSRHSRGHWTTATPVMTRRTTGRPGSQTQSTPSLVSNTDTTAFWECHLVHNSSTTADTDYSPRIVRPT